MSEEAEKNSTQLVFDGYKAAKEAKAKHTGKLMSLGNTLTEFAKAIRNPDDYVFYVDRSDSISVGKMDSGIRGSVARLAPSDFNWKELCEILDGFNLARDEKKTNAALLDSMGYKVDQ